MRIEIDKGRCLGSGQCTVLAPKVFDQDDEDGLVVVLDTTPPQPLHGAVRQAAQCCPAGVITAHER